jgi:tRNA threonylcarbamoyladenosine biosynthesis protein TsaE
VTPIHVDGEKEMLALGNALASQLLPGDVLLLFGELGAGKTVLTRGIAGGLNITEPVVSPTFTLFNRYDGALPLHHLDLYRLSGEHALYEAGLMDSIGGDAVTVIEWPERCIAELPDCHLRIVIEYGEDEGSRTVAIVPNKGFREINLI